VTQAGVPPVAGRRANVDRAVRWWIRRPNLVAAAVYAVLAVVFVGQGLLPGRTLAASDLLWSSAPWSAAAPGDVRWGGANFERADAATQFEPFQEYTRQALPHVPLWNPHTMAGRPFLANAQSAIFSPFSIPAYVMPLDKAWAVSAIMKLFVAAFGTYLLGRALGIRFAGALLAGVVFAFGTFFVTWLVWPLGSVFAVIPWLLLLTELLVRRPGPLPAAGLAAVVALAFLGGHPESSFHAIVATMVFFVVRIATVGRGGRDRLWQTSAAFAFALLTGALVAAAMLVPLGEFFLESADYARRSHTQPGHAESRFLGAFFLPDYWGRPTQTPLAGVLSNRGFYAGGLTLMLAVAALALRPNRGRIAAAVAAALALGLVLGVEPVFSVVTALPGFSTAHNGRLVIIVLLMLALLAGWGLDELTTSEPLRGRGRSVALAGATAIFCAPAVWMLLAGAVHGPLGPALKVAWGFADPPPTPIGPLRDIDALRAVGGPVPASTIHLVRLSALLQWLVLAGAALALIAAALRRRAARGRPRLAPTVVGVAAIALVAADLFRADMGFNPAIPVAHAEQPATNALRYLQAQRPNRFAGFSRAGAGQALPPNLALRYGLYDARGYDYPVELRYDRFWRATAAPPGEFVPPTSRAEANARALRGMSLLSVRDLLQHPEDPPVHLPGLRLAYSGPDGRVYRNARALPRTFLVAQQRTVADGDAALTAVTGPRLDARRIAVTERALPGLPEAARPRARRPPAGRAHLVAYHAERVVAEAAAQVPSLVVLTDVYYPGWKATVDGRPATIERVDYLLRGVLVPPGRHRVEFTYEPASWRVGWVLSFVGLSLLAATALVGWWRRRRSGPATATHVRG
jgi:hypothetical protein